MDKFINELFENLKEELIKDVDEKYRQRLEEGYKKYLTNIYSRVTIMDNTYDEFLKSEIEDNKKVLSEYSDQFKLALYITDDNYEGLDSLSLVGYNLALDKLKNNVTSDEKQISKNIELMEEYLKKVEPFNILRAYRIYSEGLLDYDYASGKSDSMSFRLSHNVPKQSSAERIFE